MPLVFLLPMVPYILSPVTRVLLDFLALKFWVGYKSIAILREGKGGAVVKALVTSL